MYVEESEAQNFFFQEFSRKLLKTKKNVLLK